MLKQAIKGLRGITVSAVGATDGDTTALIGIMAGKVEKLKLIAEGGTAIAAIPSPLNKKSVVVGKKDATGGRLSTMFSVPHVKPSKTFKDFAPDVIGKFDCDYVLTTKCEYAKLKFDA
jgi:hypothetical protein